MSLGSFTEKWSCKIISNYFLLYAINGFLGMIGLISIAKLDLLIMLAATVITFFYLRHQITTLDAFIIFFIASIAFSGLFQNYNKDLWYAGCRGQLYYTIFFFVGRYSYYMNLRIIKNGLYPFLFVCVIGLILYITSPPWYMNYKLQLWENSDGISEVRILEMMRLSAFWEYPYWVSYGCAITYSYLIIQTYIRGYMKKMDTLYLLFLAFIATLTQQRAPLFIIAAITLVYIVIGSFKKKKKGHTSLKTSIIYFLIAAICMFGIFMSFIDIDMLARLLEKIEVLSDASVFLDERASIFSQFRTKDITFLGDGIGRYSAAAYRMGKDAITDQQYLLTIYETGYWGALGYGVIIMAVLIKGLKSFSINYLELVIIAFYLVAMSGANCLSSFGQHIAIFWICCGRIYNHTLLLDKKKNLSKVYN
ncbi:O-antigen ligase domain-containing protein [Bacteroides gallinaceum]|uniref:O-antigen ligase domain-containing protein n=1 Tax=Bacteroides gallinaceum TaxID=1462571 RepID=UPI0025A36759|nr:O-antigen ligase domain-containing protein [Bacteroides gallinaceum]MDM8154893.1 O-antigen ligase domain-containing protein [Bacteroides gallinaceum]